MNILVVDDVKNHREMLAKPFRAAHDVRCAADLEEAEKSIENWWPDVALVDAMFPRKRNGQPVFAFESFLELLEDKRDIDLEMPQVILVSGQNETARRFEDVRQWLTFGRVADVIPKSTADVGVDFYLAVVRLRVEALLERRRWREVQNNAQAASDWFAHFGIITNSPRMLALKTHLIAAANSAESVLIAGTSGCGKELFARAIHCLARPGKPFVDANCAAIPSELFESEIFGVKGVGRNNPPYISKAGFMEAAGDGVLFLDEIQDLKPVHQAALLRPLQERSFRRVGATEPTPFHAKLITATSRNLLEEVERGAFRQELYFRIAAFEIRIPDLNERREDIPLLADHFLREFVRTRHKQGHACPEIHLHPRSLALLVPVDWKGNVRVFRHVIERSADFAVVENPEQNTAVMITPELLMKYNPQLRSATPAITTSDQLLAKSSTGAERWSELNETRASTIEDAIIERLSDAGKAEFERMKLALQPRGPEGEEGSEGRSSQDPAAIHCLKALLYLLLQPGNRANLQDLGVVLGLKWTQAKKVMNVLAAQEPSSPRYGAFVTLPLRGGRQEAQLVREILKPTNFLDSL